MNESNSGIPGVYVSPVHVSLFQPVTDSRIQKYRHFIINCSIQDLFGIGCCFFGSGQILFRIH